jgi:leucyl-tRNA synthetase
MEYKFDVIEPKWQQRWIAEKAYQVTHQSDKPKYYVLDMFPYPSGAGLHVGHPLGYIASDIVARYKRLKGYNVLHPMGYDAFGLPAEQYAIEHGVHPAISTEKNINNFRGQLDKIGFCFDWSREVRTCNADYYKWTQWIFLQLYHSFYNRLTNRTEPIEKLISTFEQGGNIQHPVPNVNFTHQIFTADEWTAFNEITKQEILMQYRIAFCGYGEVNWCEALGTVLANDEVVNGVSERGGHPVEKRKLRQWYLRITEYAERLLEGLNQIEFSESMKEMQTNWIGRSVGAEIDFEISPSADTSLSLKVYTTRPDTIFGADFMVVAPEHDIIQKITIAECQKEVDAYLQWVKSRSERERMAEKKISGVFTGAYCKNPFDGRLIPIWVSEYVLAGYGTGAIMAVPCGDDRDFKFAKHFGISITNIIGSAYDGSEANPTKEAILENSDFLNGMVMKDAISAVVDRIEDMGIGKKKINYKMRDAAFSRQRYWGEPFPIIWKEGTAFTLKEKELPVLLPEMREIKAGKNAEGPLSLLEEWKQYQGGIREVNTMPGYAGSSWYFLRYMDPLNADSFCSRTASDYWGQVDLYVGGTEHAVGHLLYSRMWTKALFDLGHIGFDEPYKKLLNQGMIQGSSRFVYRVRGKNEFVSAGLKNQYETDALHVDVNIVDGYELDINVFKQWRNGEFANAEFILEDGKYICGMETEKMSKSKFNTVNPDDLVAKYGADTFRMYEMFLGPIDQSKPWDTKGIEGVHRFIKKLWRLFFDETKGVVFNNEAPTSAELKILHKSIKKIEEDTERFSFNTAVSAFMVCVNELSDVKCHKKEILESLLILLTPYAPHICEELWEALGNKGFVIDAAYPVYHAPYTAESMKDYPVSVNGKMRTTIQLPVDISEADAREFVLSNQIVDKWIDGKEIKKFIFVKGRMINLVIA